MGHIFDLSRLTMKDLTAAQIDEQLAWHRKFYDTAEKGQKLIPITTHLQNKAAKLKALVAAVERYNVNPLVPLPTVESVMAELMNRTAVVVVDNGAEGENGAGSDEE